MRKPTKEIKIGNVRIGNNNPIAVQSMCNTLTKDADATIRQIHELEDAGCEIVRVSVPDIESANALKEIKENISIPLVADIHFDYRLAVESAKHADKLRINPGNIGSEEKIKAVVNAAKEFNLPIRVGVNAGSLQRDFEKKHGVTAEAMVESAMRNVGILEKLGFEDIVVSLKASDVLKTIEAYTLFSERSNYPLHVGVTEAGTKFAGTINSAVGIGALLLKGIGDTIRVSLSANPVEEVRVGKQILRAAGLRHFGVKVIACPTCARANFDVEAVAKELEKQTENVKEPLTVAIMGCGVNGPGEAKEADFGIVGGKGENLFYRKGKIEGRVKEKDIVGRLMEEIRK
jgi:(E)-4-hydroxy-3-methylbut-2-enyl-diphosphate synthase